MEWATQTASAPKSNFRFTPEGGLKSDIGTCSFRANKRLMHRRKTFRYSMISLAVSRMLAWENLSS
jgi:hypothetical protein